MIMKRLASLAVAVVVDTFDGNHDARQLEHVVQPHASGPRRMAIPGQ